MTDRRARLAATRSPESARFYVRAIQRKGRVVAYSVNDMVNGIESEHARYDVSAEQTFSVALYLANLHRDDLNAGVL